MKTLYLLRHAKAESADSHTEDFDRVLSVRGVAECKLIADYLYSLQYRPSCILYSSAARTKQTYELIAQHASLSGLPVADRRLYLAPAEKILEYIRAVDAHLDSVMVIGHNPGMHRLVCGLADTESLNAFPVLHSQYPTGTLTVAHYDCEDWQEIEHGKGKITDCRIPAVI